MTSQPVSKILKPFGSILTIPCFIAIAVFCSRIDSISVSCDYPSHYKRFPISQDGIQAPLDADMNRFSAYFKRKIYIPLLKFLKQGISPEKLAFTVALGITFGLIPFIGVNTVLLTLLAIVFRLNLIAIQIINYAVYPLQLLLILPFFKVAEIILGVNIIPVTRAQFIGLFEHHVLDFIYQFWQVALMAHLLWIFISIPIGLIVYHVSLRAFRRYLAKEKSGLPITSF